MAQSKLRRTTGTIVAIQEERFRLETERGVGLLLTLATRSVVCMDCMEMWFCSGIPVSIEYLGEPNRSTGVAYSVRPAAVSLRKDGRP